MSQVDGLTEAGLRTPKAAAIAGVVFSLLTLASFGLLWSAIPAEPQASGAWVVANANEVALALNLIPFAGIAFLWFIGVIRDRLGRREDSLFATVFFGSALLFPACCLSPRRSSAPR
jgi:MFS family permease